MWIYLFWPLCICQSISLGYPNDSDRGISEIEENSDNTNSFWQKSDITNARNIDIFRGDSESESSWHHWTLCGFQYRIPCVNVKGISGVHIDMYIIIANMALSKSIYLALDFTHPSPIMPTLRVQQHTERNLWSECVEESMCRWCTGMNTQYQSNNILPTEVWMTLYIYAV